MKHQLGVKSRLRNQQNHPSELESQLKEDKQFNQNQHQPQLKMKIIIRLKQEAIIKN
jgi:hypothetical protein